MSYLAHTKSHPLDAAAFRSFIFQGKALFTLENKEKGTHITFKVKSPKRRRGTPEDLTVFDIEAKALNDGYSGMRYLGRLDRKTRILKESGRVPKDHPGILTLHWLMRNWSRLEEFERDGKLAMYHLGICCKCGLSLTVPESIQNGIGPQCKKYRESGTVAIMKEMGIYVPGMKFNDLVRHACEERPDMIEKYYIPDEVRRNSDYIEMLLTVHNLGLF
jgi:hypothetical protein